MRATTILNEKLTHAISNKDPKMESLKRDTRLKTVKKQDEEEYTLKKKEFT